MSYLSSGGQYSEPCNCSQCNMRTYYLVVRISDFEPFIVTKDGSGTSTLDSNGYQTFYKEFPIGAFLTNPHINVINNWQE